MGSQVIGHNQSIWGNKTILFLNLCVNTNNLRCFIKIGAILDFDSLYKFEMTFFFFYVKAYLGINSMKLKQMA